MKVKIIETGAILDLEYRSSDPTWQAEDVWGMFGFEPEREEAGDRLHPQTLHLLTRAQFEFWSGVFARLEALDATGVGFSAHDAEIRTDTIKHYVADMERVAAAVSR